MAPRRQPGLRRPRREAVRERGPERGCSTGGPGHGTGPGACGGYEAPGAAAGLCNGAGGARSTRTGCAGHCRRRGQRRERVRSIARGPSGQQRGFVKGPRVLGAPGSGCGHRKEAGEDPGRGCGALYGGSGLLGAPRPGVRSVARRWRVPSQKGPGPRCRRQPGRAGLGGGAGCAEAERSAEDAGRAGGDVPRTYTNTDEAAAPRGRGRARSPGHGHGVSCAARLRAARLKAWGAGAHAGSSAAPLSASAARCAARSPARCADPARCSRARPAFHSQKTSGPDEAPPPAPPLPLIG